MEVNVLVFGQLTEITKTQAFKMRGVHDTDIFWRRLFTQFPELKNQEFKLAINQDLVSRKERRSLNSNTTLALMPPFSGG